MNKDIEKNEFFFENEKLNIDKVQEFLIDSKGIVESAKEYNILVNDLKVEEVNIDEMKDVFFDNYKLLQNIDNNIFQLESINKNINIQNLEKRLKMEKKDSSVVEE